MKTKENPKILIDSSSPEERRGFLKKLGSFVAGATALGAFTNLKAKNTFSGTEVSSYLTADPYIGSIGLFAGNFAIRQFALCHGQLLPINTNQALFSILGCTFGGDCRTTFALPDLRGRAAVGAGHGDGLSERPLGQKTGTQTVTLTANQIPAHNHLPVLTDPTYEPYAFAGRGTLTNNPAGNVLGKPSAGTEIYVDDTPAAPMGISSVKNTNPGAVTIFNQGSTQPHNNMMPYLVLHYEIALQGLFPPRN